MFRHRGVQGRTGAYRGVQGRTGAYRGVQGRTGAYRGVQGRTGAYRGVQGLLISNWYVNSTTHWSILALVSDAPAT